MIKPTPRVPLLLIWLIFLANVAATQNDLAQAQAPAQQAADQPPEISSHDTSTTFKVNVKLVLVRVMVRDSSGHAIGNLHKEDFQIFDKGNLQVISQFEVERPGMEVAKERKSATELSSESTAASPKKSSVPERYIAYVFDDEHLKFGNLATVREAAKRHFESLLPTDRAAVFTTSGKTMLDFTYDRSQLDDALSHIAPPPAETASCPELSYYMADLIVNKNDQEALQVATQDYLSCTPSNSAEITARQAQDPLLVAVKLAPRLVPSVAMRELGKGDMASHLSLDALKDVIKRVSLLPGQRSVVLVSPGFLIPRMQYEFGDIVDRAIHSQVMINVIDARGLFALIPGGDASKRVGIIDPDPNENRIGDPTVARSQNQKQSTLIDPAVLRSQYQTQSALEETNVLSSFADETGGAFVHNNNDFDDAFSRVAGAPEYSYLLGFSPEKLKSDGSFHPLKVTIKNQEKVTIQARRGYFAPKKVTDPEEEAKQEILDALFSREEIHELPVELHTQFFKANDSGAKLTVLAHVDVQRLHFRKADGRNDNVLTCDSALFNQNGSYLQGIQKVVSLHLKDETLEHKLPSGITLKTSFDVKPGSYLVRLVVRDAEGQLMSAETGAVEIP